MNGNKTYSITPISNNDSDRVIDFLRRFFFPDEPLKVFLGLMDDPDNQSRDPEQYYIDCIPQGVSVMAVDPNGNILGVCINDIMSRKDEDWEDKCKNRKESSNLKYRKIMKLFRTAYQGFNLFEQYPEVDKGIYIGGISVDRAYRGHGIAKALFDKTIGLAQELNIPLLQVDCTSHYSAKAAERLGFQCVYTLVYSEYLDSEGKPVFKPEPPHTCLKTLVYHVTIAK